MAGVFARWHHVHVLPLECEGDPPGILKRELHKSVAADPDQERLGCLGEVAVRLRQAAHAHVTCRSAERVRSRPGGAPRGGDACHVSRTATTPTARLLPNACSRCHQLQRTGYSSLALGPAGLTHLGLIHDEGGTGEVLCPDFFAEEGVARSGCAGHLQHHTHAPGEWCPLIYW